MIRQISMTLSERGLLHDHPISIRLTAYYKTAGALLRELSRAVNQGRTRLSAESGLPVGTRLTLALTTAALPKPIEVVGTVTSRRARGALFEMVLRYDFEPERFRTLLAQTIAVLEREDPPRKPRTEARIPVALEVAAGGLARTVRTTVQNFSREGCRLELRAPRLPRLQAGDRLEMTISGGRAGSRRPMRIALELRWAGREQKSGKGKRLVVGGRFLNLTRTSRERIAAIVRFEDVRPTIRIRHVVPARPAARGRRPRR
jgi:PilZ domain-containing protein